MLTSMTYISRPNLPPESPEIEYLWMQALDRNADDGITGVLYFDGRTFLHYLEGDEQNVAELFSRIEKDDRHHDIRVLAQTDIASRLFGFWSLKLIDGSRSPPLKRAFAYDDLAGYNHQRANRLAFRLLRI